MNGNRAARSTVVLFLACAAASLGVAQVRASCLSSFEAKGSIFKGRVYSTFADFPNVTVAVAVERLRQQLPSKEVDILAVDAEQGKITARQRPLANQRALDADFEVSPVGNGVRVKMVLTLPPGAFGAPGLRESMCDSVNLAATDPPPGAGGVPASGAGSQPLGTAPGSPGAAVEPPPYEPQEPPLTNDDVVKLTKAGLAPSVIVGKIDQASAVDFDLSTDGLIALGRMKVASDVIVAMQHRAKQQHR